MTVAKASTNRLLHACVCWCLLPPSYDDAQVPEYKDELWSTRLKLSCLRTLNGQSAEVKLSGAHNALAESMERFTYVKQPGSELLVAAVLMRALDLRVALTLLCDVPACSGSRCGDGDSASCSCIEGNPVRCLYVDEAWRCAALMLPSHAA